MEVASGGKECDRSVTGPFGAVGTDNETTSCPFARNVRDAYLHAGINGGTGEVTAYSPVTGKTYQMQCSGNSAFCTGGVAARVVIYGGDLKHWHAD